MPTLQLYPDDVLDPIPNGPPAGVQLRMTTQWDQVREARRADDDLTSGKWAKKERKDSNWKLTEELCLSLLKNESKDLQLALWLTEAAVQLHGFAGLRDGLRITRELVGRYWDDGLFPSMEDGPEDRAGPFEWLNEKLVDSIATISITAREGQGEDYSFNDLQEAQGVGSAEKFKISDDEVDYEKKKSYDLAIEQGRISMEMFERASKETSLASYEGIRLSCQQALEEFVALERIVDDKFGDAAPHVTGFKNSLSEIARAIEDSLKRAYPTQSIVSRPPPILEQKTRRAVRPIDEPLWLLQTGPRGSNSSMGTSWDDAEKLVGSGDVEGGLAEMCRLAASETTGRNRFQRKLLLAETCLATNREHLARTILEELAEQIDKSQLELWESPALISSVWGRLSAVYKTGSDASDLDRANKLYLRLCRLDPWQALDWDKGGER